MNPFTKRYFPVDNSVDKDLYIKTVKKFVYDYMLREDHCQHTYLDVFNHFFPNNTSMCKTFCIDENSFIGFDIETILWKIKSVQYQIYKGHSTQWKQRIFEEILTRDRDYGKLDSILYKVAAAYNSKEKYP